MGIWLKKFSCGWFLKLIALVILCFSGIVLAEYIIFDNIAGGYELNRESYFNTYVFKEYYIGKAGYVRDWIVRYSDDKIFDPDSITKEQVEEYKQYYNDDYQDDLSVKNKIIKDRQEYFKIIQKELSGGDKSFVFLARDKETGKVVTNIETYTGNNAETIIKDLSQRKTYLLGNAESFVFEGREQSQDNYYIGDGLLTYEEKNRYEIHTAIDEAQVEANNSQDYFTNMKVIFDRLKQAQGYVQGAMLAGLLGGLLAIAYLTWASGKKYGHEGVKLSYFDKIPMDVQSILGIPFVFILIWICAELMEKSIVMQWFMNREDIFSRLQIIRTIFFVGTIVLGVLVAVGIYLSGVRQLKAHRFIKNLLCYRILHFLFNALFQEKTLPLGVLLATGGYAFLNGFLMLLFFKTRSLIFFLPLLGLNLLMIIGEVYFVMDYKRILMGAKRIAKGELSYKITSSEIFPAAKELADAVNSIGEGMNHAAQNAFKSERLKTELITNVSHDLKTPLTSIISYIDLLLQEEIENEEAKEYIGILAERSERLKQLIEDLVEASKATTGNLNVELTTIQFHQLVEQVVGEYSDKLGEKGLEIVFAKLQEITISADGRHMWRITENLVTNIMKYAMPNTRVYIEVFKENEYGVLTIKNISKEPLNIAPDELTERFVRGDAARNTEGSGLGLAIAQSLTYLQKGSFNIGIDGDLFKVTVKIPLA